MHRRTGIANDLLEESILTKGPMGSRIEKPCDQSYSLYKGSKWSEQFVHVYVLKPKNRFTHRIIDDRIGKYESYIFFFSK